MSTVTLVHPNETRKISGLHAIIKCTLFQNNFELAVTPYKIRTSVSLSDFREFISALEGKSIEITGKNLKGLWDLSEEFGFGELTAQLSQLSQHSQLSQFSQHSQHRQSMLSRTSEQENSRNQIIGLERLIQQRDPEIVNLNPRETALSPLAARIVTDQVVMNAKRRLRDENECFEEEIDSEMNETDISSIKLGKELYIPSFNSEIISEFPNIFDDFRGKRFCLRWQGNRDGFGAKNFHQRCDGHGNTLIVILDKSGNIFGGFTPGKWGSENGWRSDHSLKSFVFTLKNPQNTHPMKFALKRNMKDQAFHCMSGWGPCFGNDIVIYDNCNSHGNNSTDLGFSYINHTGLNGKSFFVGTFRFTVEKIEVFEISD